MSFAPDTLRPATYFRGRITKQVEFREAISALHDVVTADLRFIPKDRSAYHAWRAQQSYIDTAQLVADQLRVAQEMTALQGELAALEARSVRRRQAFYLARQRYFQHLYQRDKDLWYKLDPVITVHPIRCSSSASRATSPPTAGSPPRTADRRPCTHVPHTSLARSILCGGSARRRIPVGSSKS